MKQVQFRGGTTDAHMSGNGTGFIGLPREITVDTTEWSIRIHDGSKVGGHLLSLKDSTYTKDEVDRLVANIVSGGTIQLDGYATITQLNRKSDSTHMHENYSLLTHVHDEYSQNTHEHMSPNITFGDGETLEYKYQNNLLSNVDMANYITSTELSNHTHTGYSEANHTHLEYSESSHEHEYASVNHSHLDLLSVSEFNEAIQTKSDKGHIHSTKDLIFNDSDIESELNIINEHLANHLHDDRYYTKKETDDIVNNYDIKNKKILVDKLDWIYSDANESYYFQIYHDLNSKFLNAKGISNRGIEYLDIIPLSDNEAYVINDIDIEMNVMISTIE